MNTHILIFFCFIFHKTSSQTEITALENLVEVFRVLRRIYFNAAIPLMGQKPEKLQNRVLPSVPFPCNLTNSKSLSKPESVHKLRPGDIDVIAAIGDSLTAGIGLTGSNLLLLVVEERGKVFSIGGESDWREFFTLPNILKVFNPNLVGYSTSTSLSVEKESHLNVAEGAAISADTPHMARELIKRMKFDKNIDIEKDWKMITIFIGGNDFCNRMCFLKNPASAPDDHKKDLIQVLRLLRDNLPRTIVNLVSPPPLRLLVELQVNPICELIHLVECPCFFGLQFENWRHFFYNIIQRWYELDEEIIDLAEFDGDDFTVVIQPFPKNYTLPTVAPHVADERYFAEDCFHFSQKFHARIANDLWNNIMEPVGQKTPDGNILFKKFICPTEKNPYIFTRRNS